MPTPLADSSSAADSSTATLEHAQLTRLSSRPRRVSANARPPSTTLRERHSAHSHQLTLPGIGEQAAGSHAAGSQAAVGAAEPSDGADDEPPSGGLQTLLQAAVSRRSLRLPGVMSEAEYTVASRGKGGRNGGGAAGGGEGGGAAGGACALSPGGAKGSSVSFTTLDRVTTSYACGTSVAAPALGQSTSACAGATADTADEESEEPTGLQADLRKALTRRSTRLDMSGALAEYVVSTTGEGGEGGGSGGGSSRRSATACRGVSVIGGGSSDELSAAIARRASRLTTASSASSIEAEEENVFCEFCGRHANMRQSLRCNVCAKVYHTKCLTSAQAARFKGRSWTCDGCMRKAGN
jgi:hypothetical protein